MRIRLLQQEWYPSRQAYFCAYHASTETLNAFYMLCYLLATYLLQQGRISSLKFVTTQKQPRFVINSTTSDNFSILRKNIGWYTTLGWECCNGQVWYLWKTVQSKLIQVPRTPGMLKTTLFHYGQVFFSFLGPLLKSMFSPNSNLAPDKFKKIFEQTLPISVKFKCHHRQIFV